MRILITSAAAPLAHWLAADLGQAHDIRLTERFQIDTDDEFVCCTLNHDFSTNLLVRDMDAIVHVAEPSSDETPEQQLDYLTRGTYNLLWAATKEGIRRVVYLSTMALMSQYDPAFIVTEQWRPRPTTAPFLLAKHLGESVCREFAREHRLQIGVLRLGHVVRAEAVETEAVDPTTVDKQDVAQAVAQALTKDLGYWSVFHILAGSAQTRFPMTNAARRLGYNPTVSFDQG